MMQTTDRFCCEKSDTTIIASKSITPSFLDYFFLTFAAGSSSYELTMTKNDARNLADLIYGILGDDEPNPDQDSLAFAQEGMTA